MATKKTYVLLPHTEPSAPIYQALPNDQKVRLNKRPIDHAYLRQTFTDKDGNQRVIRLKLNSNTIFQDEQIKAGILANEPFTPAEKKAVEFRMGILETDKDIVQKFLDASPQNEAFDGLAREDGVRALFKVYSIDKQLQEESDDFDRRIDAGMKIKSITDLKVANDLLLRLNGAFFKVPDNLLEAKRLLKSFLENADDAMLDKLLDEKITQDDEAIILMGQLIDKGIISFDDVTDQVAKKKGQGWVNIKKISSELEPEERQRLFLEHLSSPDGKILMDELKKDLEKTEKKPALV
jgi:hypothetical protein